LPFSIGHYLFSDAYAEGDISWKGQKTGFVENNSDLFQKLVEVRIALDALMESSVLRRAIGWDCLHFESRAALSAFRCDHVPMGDLNVMSLSRGMNDKMASAVARCFDFESSFSPELPHIIIGDSRRAS
jgi:hypothetical protein